MYKITHWEGSDWKEEKPNWLGVGEYDLRIKDCILDSQTDCYTIYVEDVQSDQQGRFSYYIRSRDGSINSRSVGTLISLGKALFGEVVGVPHFEDVIHGVVHAKIEAGKEYQKQDGTIGNYTAIYHFDPVSEEVLELVRASGVPTIEQYTEG